MNITKLGHCCLLIEVEGKRIMTDPGSFTADEHVLSDIDVILYTHEHADHFHLESLKALVEKNPAAVIIANSGVGALLDEAEVAYTCLEGSAAADIAGVHFTACDAPHEEIFENVGQVQNTGYFITERLFYPGDAYAEPGTPVEILALPVSGPWCRVADVIAYAHTIAPKTAFPVHDGLLNEAGIAITHRVVGANLLPETEFVSLRAGESREF